MPYEMNMRQQENRCEMKMRDDWLWLCAVPGLYHSQRAALLDYFGSPEAIRQAPREEFALWEKTGSKWVRRLYGCQKDSFLPAVKQRLGREGILFLQRDDAGYPQRLRQIQDAPYGVFVKGNSECLMHDEVPGVAVVGARACSEYGRNMAEQIGEILADYGITLISGMALGIDGIAQRAAVAAGGASIGVLGCGVSICYPQEHFNLYHDLQARGCVMSEFPPDAPGLKGNFPQRNRIISGLADVTVVVEARVKSGSLITADYAAEQGKDVLAVPGRSTDTLSGGCNRLIEQGAGILLSPENLIQYLQCRFPDHFAREEKSPAGKQKKKRLTGEMRLVYDHLDVLPTDLECLQKKTGLSPQKLMQVLLRLQLADLVAERGKNQYVRYR